MMGKRSLVALGLLCGGALAADLCFVPETVDGTNDYKLCVNNENGSVYTQKYDNPRRQLQASSAESEPEPEPEAEPVAPTPAPVKSASSELSAAVEQIYTDIDAMWIIICGALVFFMQAGFGILEAGTISEKNVINIMYKNIMDASIAAIFFWLIGYGFAYGGPNDNAFIGGENFALSNDTAADSGWHSFFFQWAFAATAATIVAGSVAERCRLEAYFVYSIILTAFIYPVVVHWVWDDNGWISAFNADSVILADGRDGPGGNNNMIDFAGCAVVHMVGGFAGLVAAILIGPRAGRFDPEMPDPKPHNVLLASLGVLFLWFGWFGFNCGSTLAISNNWSNVAGRVATTTVISAASACCTAALMGRLIWKSYDLLFCLNAILAGLVAITSSCAYVDPWAALVIGAIGCVIYKGASLLLIKLGIDDPLDAAPVHGFVGMWGALCPGIFSTDQIVADVLYGDGTSNDAIASGRQFATQLIGVLAVLGWTVVTSLVLFGGIMMTIGLRVDPETESAGLDKSEHNGEAYYYISDKKPKPDAAAAVEMAPASEEAKPTATA